MALPLSRVLRSVKTDIAPQHTDSVSRSAYEIIYGLIHRMASVVFVGKPLCHDPAWTKAVTAFPIDVEISKMILLPFPDFLRPFIVPLIPARRRIDRHRANVRNLLFPSSGVSSTKGDLTVLKLLVQATKDHDPQTLTMRVLLLTAAAVSSCACRGCYLQSELTSKIAPDVLNGYGTCYIRPLCHASVH